MRTILIGDIHGCLTEFTTLVQQLNLRHKDRVICLGDFMDKGPYPAECVSFARECGFESVLGNHEERHIRWRLHEERRRKDPTYKNPMRPLSDEHQRQNAELSEADMRWLKTLPLFIKFAPNWIAVHGGLLPKIPVEQQDSSTLIRARWVDATGEHVPVDYDNKEQPVPPGSRHWAEVYDGKASVVYGHDTHGLRHPTIHTGHRRGACYGLDTGCVYGGRLTAAVLTPKSGRRCEVRFHQVCALMKYASPIFPIPDGR